MSASYYQSYAIYGEGHSLEAAALWVQGLLMAQVGTSIAVLAVAIAGMNMLWGRVSVREGGRILLGCFVLFGAPAIARGLMSNIESRPPSISVIMPQPLAATSPMPASPVLPATVNPFDPYAGASPSN